MNIVKENVFKPFDMMVMEEALESIGKTLARDFNEIKHINFEKREKFIERFENRTINFIINLLHQKRLDYGIITKSMMFQEEAESKWIINLLDGRENFLRGIGVFCCAIAVMKNNEIVSSMILDPMNSDLFAADEKGVFLNYRKVYVSKNVEIEKSMFGLNQNINNPNIKQRKLGSTLLNMAYVANGKLDGCIERPTHLCDYAAGLALVKKVDNGLVSVRKDKKISELPLDNDLLDLPSDLICSNEKLHDYLKKSI
ncbi:inositol monophosphatase family protein [Candidatus Cytomitobacter indipagum]|nr:inositol monophosphatase family protein [Candidatus Cytomitobacter indipagum]